MFLTQSCHLSLLCISPVCQPYQFTPHYLMPWPSVLHMVMVVTGLSKQLLSPVLLFANIDIPKTACPAMSLLSYGKGAPIEQAVYMCSFSLISPLLAPRSIFWRDYVFHKKVVWSCNPRKWSRVFFRICSWILNPAGLVCVLESSLLKIRVL